MCDYPTCPTCGVMLPCVVHSGTTIPCEAAVYVPPCPRCAELQAEVARLTALLHRVVMLLDASSCYSCGAEPGCNIDCGLCHLTAELQREGLAPKENR